MRAKPLHTTPTPSTHRSPLTPAQLYDGLAPLYDDLYGTPMAHAENAVIFRRIAPLVKRTDYILDVGCGTGLFLDELPVAPFRYRGIDLSAGILREAARKHPQHEFLQDDMHLLSTCVDGEFDLIVCLFGSFSYASRPSVVINTFSRVLRPGGRVIVLPNSSKKRSRSSYGYEEAGLALPPPPFRVPAQQLKQLFELAFDHVRVQGFHAFAEDRFSWLPAPLLRAYLRIEMATVGRITPDACYFYLLTAEKGAAI